MFDPFFHLGVLLPWLLDVSKYAKRSLAACYRSQNHPLIGLAHVFVQSGDYLEVGSEFFKLTVTVWHRETYKSYPFLVFGQRHSPFMPFPVSDG